MLNITATQHNHPTTGACKVTANGKGRQRTVPYDYGLSPEANQAAAVGALLNVLLTDREKAKILHPSGGQRVRQSFHTPVSHIWHINV